MCLWESYCYKLKNYWYEITCALWTTSFHLISINSFFLFFWRKLLNLFFCHLIQKSKIKINSIYLIQSIFHLWCLLNRHQPSAFSDRESLFYQQRSPISRCRPWDFVSYRKEISATIKYPTQCCTRFQLIPTIWSQQEQN